MSVRSTAVVDLDRMAARDPRPYKMRQRRRCPNPSHFASHPSGRSSAERRRPSERRGCSDRATVESEARERGRRRPSTAHGPARRSARSPDAERGPVEWVCGGGLSRTWGDRTPASGGGPDILFLTPVAAMR
ncbi:hypothetical protein GUJ93_ZPchr0013g34656 [Zizania palustris]|uniref:Uncharacterized protein n=1 Tax=Zizania palustris TaxID=103762 RepID=A0A8J5WVY3_ZIZPA|nr:hypothetical protein GUJ93_ZPchr0013g34656 [Zizania palustris]